MTMHEVAKLAGVSTSTVSRVVRDDPSVAAQTAAAVKRVVREVSFRPATRRSRPRQTRHGALSGTIGFLVFGASRSSATPGFEMLLRGVSSAANSHGLRLALNFLPHNIGDSLFVRGEFDGILCHGDQPEAPQVDRLREFPTVWLMANRRRAQWGDQVMPNNAAIGHMAATYLLGRGHRRLAYLGAGGESWAMRLRSFTFTKAAQDAGAQVRVLQSAPQATDYWRFDGLTLQAEQMVQQLLHDDALPTGLFIEEDRLLPAIDRALHVSGIRARQGGQLEIIACNNELPHYQELAAQPARIDIHPEAIGQRGVEQLLRRMRDGNLERSRVMIEPTLIPPGANGTTVTFRNTDKSGIFDAH